MSLSCTVNEILIITYFLKLRSHDSEHNPFGSNAYTRTPMYQSVHEILSAWLHQLQRYDWGKI